MPVSLLSRLSSQNAQKCLLLKQYNSHNLSQLFEGGIVPASGCTRLDPPSAAVFSCRNSLEIFRPRLLESRLALQVRKDGWETEGIVGFWTHF